MPNKTPLGLNQWAPNDKPKMNDFNADNVIIDAALGSLNEKFANGAGAHNSIYRGKFLGNSVSSEQYAAIQSGDFTDLYIGDYWTIGGVNYRIAAFDYYFGGGETEANTVKVHHATIVPDANVGAAKRMNPSNVTTGAYVGSEMRGATTGIAAGNMAEAMGIINTAFSGHIMQHRVYLTNAVSTAAPAGYQSAGAWYDSTIELMNEIMVYGSGIFSPVSNGTNIPVNHTLEKTQLPLFRLRPDLIRAKNVPLQNYWLRDVISAQRFAIVVSTGQAAIAYSNATTTGIRPAFSITGEAA